MCLSGDDADVPLVIDIRQLSFFVSGCVNVSGKIINVCDNSLLCV